MLKLVAAIGLLSALPTVAQSSSQELVQGWEVLADRGGRLTSGEVIQQPGWRPVRVGVSWNAQFDDLREYMGVAWYRTAFHAANDSGHVLLRFGAVDYLSEVFLDGKSLGIHEGGYTPFQFDISGYLSPKNREAGTAAHQLLVRVYDPPMGGKGSPGDPEYPYNEIPHGKQNWYVQTGGIWQGVTLESLPSRYISRVHVTPQMDGRVAIDLVMAGNVSDRTAPIEVTVRGPAGGPEFVSGAVGNSATDPNPITGTVAHPQYWSPEHPFLYTAEVSVAGQTVSERFGFRKLEAREGKLFLNGQPFYMIAALDQDFYPDTIYSVPSESYVRDMMIKGKRLGLNTLRCHIKVCQPEYLRAADEVGMLVWYEIPSWNDENHFSAKAAQRGEKIFQEMVERDWNHPSIVVQSVINESWGADLKDAAQRQWLHAAFDRAKRLTAPLGRLIVDNSACCNNFHVKTDLNDFHQYYSIPDNREKWDAWVKDFASRPKWTFSPHGDAEPSGTEPLIVSEFGNWGLPQLPQELPWWFDRDFAGREVTRPAGVLKRFTDYGFNKLFRDFNALAEATQWHQFTSLKHEIEAMRRQPAIQGYVVTEFTDINWEVNGLMDMWRNPKAYAAELHDIQQPDVVLATLPKHNLVSGESIEVPIFVSHYSGTKVEDASVDWRWDQGRSGSLRLNSTSAGSVSEAGTMLLDAPAVTALTRQWLRLELRDAAGRRIAENSYELFVFPKPATRTGTIAISGISGDKEKAGLRERLQRAGYSVIPLDGQTSRETLLLAGALDGAVMAHLAKGGRALLLLDSKDALPGNLPLKVTPRAGSDLDGNWVTNFNWIRSGAPPFKAVGFSSILGFESEKAVPQYVIQGVSAEHYDDVLSGIFFGWLNNNAALAVQTKIGNGKAMLTTFRFDEYGADPFATSLLNAMIDHASAAGFAPRMESAAATAGTVAP